MRKPVIKTASPTLRQVLMEMYLQDVSQHEMAFRMQKDHARISEWSRGLTEPGIMKVEEMAAHLGYRLVLEEIQGESNGDV